MEINGFLTVENKRWDLELNLSNIFSDNLGDFSPVFFFISRDNRATKFWALSESWKEN